MNKQKEEKLPKGWSWTTVGEISELIQYGYTASSTDEAKGPKFLRITDIQNNSVDWDTVPYCKIDNESKSRYLLKEGDLVFARTGSTVGKSFLIQGLIPESVFASYLIRIRFLPEVNTKFVSYFFKSDGYQEQINKSKIGIGQPHVNGTLLSQICIPFPPATEQHYIVQEIEKQISRLDEIVKYLSRVESNVQKLRNATLKWACEGKLVLTEAELAQREKYKYESADRLLDETLRERRAQWETNQLAKMQGASNLQKTVKWRTNYAEPVASDTGNLPELPEGWVWATLEELSENIVDCLHSTPVFLKEGKYCIDTTWIEPAKIRFDRARYVSEETYQERIQRLKPERGDVLFAREGTIGTTVIVPEAVELCLGQRMMMFRPVKNILSSFFMWMMLSPSFEQQWRLKVTGTTSPHVNIRDLRRMSLPLAPYSEQGRIVNEIEKKFLRITHLESFLSRNQARVEKLRQKILRDTFAGKLTEQNPTDEPAEVLLKRIKTERDPHESESKKEGAKKPQIMKQKKNRRRKIIDVLKESKTEMTPEQLFGAAGFNPDEVEEFYAELKKADNAKAIKQKKEKDGDVYLTARV